MCRLPSLNPYIDIAADSIPRALTMIRMRGRPQYLLSESGRANVSCLLEFHSWPGLAYVCTKVAGLNEVSHKVTSFVFHFFNSTLNRPTSF